MLVVSFMKQFIGLILFCKRREKYWTQFYLIFVRIKANDVIFYLWVCGPLVVLFHKLFAVIADKNTATLGSIFQLLLH